VITMAVSNTVKSNSRSKTKAEREIDLSLTKPSTRSNGTANRLSDEDKAIHDWYRFVLSFPPHLVRDYISNLGLAEGNVLLDPFCGCGTTLVEGKMRNIVTIGVEANAFAHFATSVKIKWNIDSEQLLRDAKHIADLTRGLLLKNGIDDENPFERIPTGLTLRGLNSDQERLLLSDSISPLPLHKTLTLLEVIKQHDTHPAFGHMLLALAKTLVFKTSNLRFGPEVGLGEIKDDVSVVLPWLEEVGRICEDLTEPLYSNTTRSEALFGDARSMEDLVKERSVDAVITSPPYPNEKDYTRTTRLESVVLGFINSKEELRALKKTLIRSNTRNVYKVDDDDKFITTHPRIQTIADDIEKRRIELGKDSGFEKLYGRVTKLYFGGMARHLSQLRKVLKPGAKLAYVVGDQASYLRIMIRTGELVAEIAEALGYRHLKTDLFRTRFATATREQLREEVIVLEYPGR